MVRADTAKEGMRANMAEPVVREDEVDCELGDAAERRGRQVGL
jgi:hypothetical protein